METSNISVSVVIASKNRPDRVDRLIRSIRQQDFDEPIEFIVVDDGSQPPIVLEEAGVNLVRNEPSQGKCVACNRGFALARGEFIANFDDDVEFHEPGTLRHAIELARQHPDFGAIGFRHLWPDGTPDPYQPAKSDVICEAACFFGYGVILRASALRQTQGFEPTFIYGYEEQDLCLQLRQQGWRVMFAPELSLLHHHDHRGRDWTRIHRLISRNAIRSMLLRFPLLWVVPSAAIKWASYFAESRQRGKTDWRGGLGMLADTLRFVPYAARHRRPMTGRQLLSYRQLKKAPIPLATLEPSHA
jgi:GT2 family glycosyltransferase